MANPPLARVYPDMTAQSHVLVDVNGLALLNIQQLIASGQSFIGNSGILATATAANLTVGGLCVFNPATSGKNILIYSLQVSATNASFCDIYHVTADEAFGAPITPQNLNLGSLATSVATCDSSPNNVAASVTKHGTKILTVNQAQIQGPSEQLTNGAFILLPAGSAHGIAVYPFITTIGNQFAVLAKWLELSNLTS
jgi:hypothetical protein